ncbi:hypothetical protein NL676_032998 [Syzygium grande]|nr:hypothetical protein NL676_032998 [Syzygium grande]
MSEAGGPVTVATRRRRSAGPSAQAAEGTAVATRRRVSPRRSAAGGFAPDAAARPSLSHRLLAANPALANDEARFTVATPATAELAYFECLAARPRWPPGRDGGGRPARGPGIRGWRARRC